MTIFVWNDNFRTDLHLVDDQHKMIFDLFDELHQKLLLSTRDDETLAIEAFQRLIDYACFHFEDEEALMVQKGMDPRFIAHHHDLHEKFVDQVYALWSRRNDLNDPARTFIGFLTSWLGMHILGVDQSMARQCERIERGMSASEAYEAEQNQDDKRVNALVSMIDTLYQTLSEQNLELVHANTNLEGHVALRTQELSRANEELRCANQRLEAFSRTDGLLQIANRAYFDDRMRVECADAFRRKVPMSLIMIDVDYFKRYNDHYGHLEGDKCLKRIAQTIRRALLRTTDLVARYGGEELAVILPDTDASGARIVAERILQEIQMLAIPHARSSINRHVTISLGLISAIPPERDAPASLIAQADSALYKAKEAGRNRWCTS